MAEAPRVSSSAALLVEELPCLEYDVSLAVSAIYLALEIGGIWLGPIPVDLDMKLQPGHTFHRVDHDRKSFSVDSI